VANWRASPIGNAAKREAIPIFSFSHRHAFEKIAVVGPSACGWPSERTYFQSKQTYRMNPILYGALFALLLATGIIVLLEVGRRIGQRRLKEEGAAAAKGFGAIESAIFALLGLILAFSFSGALTRFDARRQLVVAEANDIGTAYLRVDLLPTDAQIPMRDLFRRYLDSRIETYRKLPDMEAASAELAGSVKLQGEIWTLAVSSLQKSETPQAMVLMLPALNAMIDITTTRTEAGIVHSPLIIWVMLGTLTFACALFAGYDMAIRKHLNLLHSIAFAVVLAVTVYVIIDLEYPRMGLIQMSDSDRVLVELRKSLK
jgi:hypothetical protein